MFECVVCGSKSELRLGYCFDCCEAQSIIGTGFDMYEKGDGGVEIPAKEATARLKMLVAKGWKP